MALTGGLGGVYNHNALIDAWLLYMDAVMPDLSSLGPRGEALARATLKKAGYKIIETNYSCRAGEVDIIAREGGDAVFVEVRTRKSEEFGTPAGTIDRGKWRRMCKAADHFLMTRRAEAVSRRYDIVSIVWPAGGEPKVEVLRGVLPEGRFLPQKKRR
jgi:putative endonuclease